MAPNAKTFKPGVSHSVTMRPSATISRLSVKTPAPFKLKIRLSVKICALKRDLLVIVFHAQRDYESVGQCHAQAPKMERLSVAIR